ncbi:MAG: hypothetical protein KME16_08150 [Scytolyngbya sp. HA4215-MV1]|jgi:hypothetical protein|nr:hypothetical protein [Scytolyngbya sp. HA4215-MV1]
MNLPLILDLSIGLIFIYLILSLLSSEIHEIITTLLQWRAEHLKKSIEGLLAGGGSEINDQVKQFTDQLYDDPLIKSLNQEARGAVAPFFRKVTQFIGSAYRKMTGLKNTFGKKNSGPSYIPSETFATTLLGALKIEALYQKLAESKLKKFSQDRFKVSIYRILTSLRDSKADESLLEHEFAALESKLDDILEDFRTQKAGLEITFDRFSNQLKLFRSQAKEALPESEHVVEIFSNRLAGLQEILFENEQERTVLLTNLKPKISSVVEEFKKIYEVYQLIRSTGKQADQYVFETIAAKLPVPQRERLMQLQDTFHLFTELKTELKQGNVNYEEIFDKLPPYVQECLPLLAQRAQTKVDRTENTVKQFQQEVETWFDRSMERASGVYKRNAKGVAILVGFLIAIIANADTFHIVARLSRDNVLRSTIAESASHVATTANDISQIKEKVNDALTGISLPIGWNAINLQQQQQEGFSWFFPPLRRFIGWLISGIAISMGARFWFDVLNKVMRVKTTGAIPVSSTGEPSDMD